MLVKKAKKVEKGKFFPSRGEETKEIMDFIERSCSHGNNGMLHVSGNPGTGKTLCTMMAAEHLKDEFDYSLIYINGGYCSTSKQVM